MPGIVVFRRRWSVGSDDLVVPGVFLFVLHLSWALALALVLALEPLPLLRGPPCAVALWRLLVAALALLGVALPLEGAVAAVAMRGSILDTAPRASMQYLLYARLLALAVESAWLALAGLWLARHFRLCPAGGAADALLGLVVSGASVVVSVALSMWCAWDAAGRSWVKMKEFQRSQREAEAHGRSHYRRSNSRHRNWRQRKVLRAYQHSWDHRCRLLFCCLGNSDRNRHSFADIARLLSDFFRDLDVVPSDVVAGLVLLRKFQKIERDAIVKERKNDTYEFLSGVPVTSRTQFLALNDPQHLAHFQAVIHYMHFALGAYGWPMFLMTHSATGLCHLCTRLRCCVGGDGARIVKDNCCHCNYAALRKMLEVGDVEVVFATYHVDVGETPFFVAVDATRHAVVVSIRGTLSLQDVITDLNADGEPLPVAPVRDDWLGHKGMVQAAAYIRDKLLEEGILDKALERARSMGRSTAPPEGQGPAPPFDLVLVGHSLGAGTAAILAILLRHQFPSLQCFAYSPPGGTLSMPAAEYTKDFITSVVLGKDVVPRIGLHQLESLRADLINTIKRSKDPKWKTILCSAVCCGCGPVPTSARELQAEGVDAYQAERDGARELSTHPSDASIALTTHSPLYPPGRIIHVVRHHPTKGEQKYEKHWRQMLSKHEPVYQAVWANTTDFDEVLISPVMIQDHMPDNVLEALKKVITTVGPAKPQRLSAPASLMTSAEHLDSERCALLAPPAAPVAPSPAAAPQPPPRCLYLETSFASLQSPSAEIRDASSSSGAQSFATGSSHSASAPASAPKAGSPFALHPLLAWEYASLLQDELAAAGGASPNGRALDLIHDDWLGLAPLATPESLSEVSSISSRASVAALGTERRSRRSPPPPPPPPPPPQPPPPRAPPPPPPHSSADDLSFASARAASTASESACGGGGGGGGTGASSDTFASVRGTPCSSADSVTLSAGEGNERFGTPSTCCAACAMGVACGASRLGLGDAAAPRAWSHGHEDGHGGDGEGGGGGGGGAWRPSYARRAVDGLPLLSTLGDVRSKGTYGRAYMYPITAVGRGESSV